MKNIETLFSRENFDAKNILNRSGKIIDKEQLQQIEEHGATFEQLENLGVPVFKYKTQITIHGNFPELEQTYIGGYKNLLQNKNGSIGVKWRAIDYQKKNIIYRKVKAYNQQWRIKENSQDFYIYKLSKAFQTREEYAETLEIEKKFLSSVDKTKFYGDCGVFLSRDWACYYLVTYINLGALKQENTQTVIENICGASVQAIDDAIHQKEIDEAEKQKQEQENRRQRAQKEQELKEPILERAREFLSNNGYILVKDEKIKNGDIFVKIICDTDSGDYKLNAHQFSKSGQQRKWRKKISYNNTSLNFDLWGISYEHYSDTFSGYIRREETPTPEEKRGAIFIVSYSEKAVAVFGDTKPIKDTLKNMGGRFNPYLKHNGENLPGWIFSKTMETDLINLTK